MNISTDTVTPAKPREPFVLAVVDADYVCDFAAHPIIDHTCTPVALPDLVALAEAKCVKCGGSGLGRLSHDFGNGGPVPKCWYCIDGHPLIDVQVKGDPYLWTDYCSDWHTIKPCARCVVITKYEEVWVGRVAVIAMAEIVETTRVVVDANLGKRDYACVSWHHPEDTWMYYPADREYGTPVTLPDDAQEGRIAIVAVKP